MPECEDLGQVVAVYRGSLRSVQGALSIIVICLALLVAIDCFQRGSVDNLLKVGPALVLVILGAAGSLAGLAWLHCVRFYSNGLAGRSFWSIPVRFYWTDIAGFRFDSSNGVPSVVLMDITAGREMWIFREVFLRDEFQRNLQAYVNLESIEKRV